MKQMVSIVGVCALVVLLFSIPSKTSAANDTLVVYASVANLEKVINSDTTSSGLQQHGVYKLVSLDTTYVFQGPISVKSNITVIGVLGSDGRPPCIQPETLPDNSLPNFLFELNGPNTNAVFKNLYLTGRSTDNTICTTNYNGAGALIQVSAAGIRLTVDNVIFVDWPTNNIGYSADNCSIFVTNCKFRNGNVSTAWYSGEAVRNTFNTASSDTIIMKYNTMFCMAYSACCPVTVNPVNYLEFSHNSVIYTFKNPFWVYNLTNGKMNDNLFYAAFSGASNETEHFGLWDQLRSFAITGVVDFDTLNMPMARWLDPADSAGTGGLTVLWPAEAKRKIEVKNNVCYWPKAITDFWTAWDDTSHIDSIITPVWMNTRTTNMFSDKTHWPGFVQSGNLQVDPQFGASIDQVQNANAQSGAGFFQDFTVVRTDNALSVVDYGYKMATVVANWIPQWPLPELADMQYKNTALQTGGTDGKPVGDPGWFTGGYTVVTGVANIPANVPNKFALYEAYPNPFNPSTNIQYSLGTSGNVSLKVYNVLGQLVKTIVNNAYQNAGTYTVHVDMSTVTSGVYFYSLEQGQNRLVHKMMLLK